MPCAGQQWRAAAHHVRCADRRGPLSPIKRNQPRVPGQCQESLDGDAECLRNELRDGEQVAARCQLVGCALERKSVGSHGVEVELLLLLLLCRVRAKKGG